MPDYERRRQWLRENERLLRVEWGVFFGKTGSWFLMENRTLIKKQKPDPDRSGSPFQSRSWSRLKIFNQSLVKFFQSKSAQKKSIRVRLRKVKRICMSRICRFTPEGQFHKPDFNQGLLEIFQSRFAWKFSITIRLKFFNQGLIDPDRFLDRDRDRDCFFVSRVW